VKPHLLHVFSTFVAGGPQVRTARLLAAFGERFRHTIVPMDGRSDARSLLPEGLEVEILERPRARGTISMVREMRALYRDRRPDLLLTYNWGAIEAVMAGRSMSGVPTIHHEDGFLPDELAGFKARRVWTRRLVLKGLQLIVPSKTLLGIARDLWRLDPGSTHWIPNGIEVADFPAADGNPARRAELGIPAEALVVGSVGHLRGEKNPVRLVEAAARVRSERPLHLIVLGDGPERGPVEEAVARLGLQGRVHLVGHREDTAEDYRTMDVFCLSSDTEQMPVALLEAMAAALPACSTDVGDVRSILPEAQADYVTPKDAGALADALSRIQEADLAALGRANRERVLERFTFEAMVASYLERFDHALAQRSSR